MRTPAYHDAKEINDAVKVRQLSFTPFTTNLTAVAALCQVKVLSVF